MHNNIENLSVLGFPCNQFGAQEPGSNQEILEFAQSNYAVNFPMFAKLDVNGDKAPALFQWLKSSQQDDEGNEAIAWNFTKFLIKQNGEVVKRFHPKTTPEEISASLSTYL